MKPLGEVELGHLWSRVGTGFIILIASKLGTAIWAIVACCMCPAPAHSMLCQAPSVCLTYWFCLNIVDASTITLWAQLTRQICTIDRSGLPWSHLMQVRSADPSCPFEMPNSSWSPPCSFDFHKRILSDCNIRYCRQKCIISQSRIGISPRWRPCEILTLLPPRAKLQLFITRVFFLLLCRCICGRVWKCTCEIFSKYRYSTTK